MSVLDVLISNLTAASNSGPEQYAARGFIDRLHDASTRAAAPANPSAAFADWDRAVRALETLTSGSSGGPLDSGNTAAAEQRTAAAIARANGALVARQVIDAVSHKPGAYAAAARAAERATIASSDLAAEMVRAQQFLNWLALA